MPLQEALTTGAMALFGEKYDEFVRVVSMGSSTELCGGTHVRATGQIGLYITIQETSIAAGIRRIEALTGHGAEAYLRRRNNLLENMAATLQTQPDTLGTRVERCRNVLQAGYCAVAGTLPRHAGQRLNTTNTGSNACLLDSDVQTNLACCTHMSAAAQFSATAHRDDAHELIILLAKKCHCPFVKPVKA